MRFSQFVLTGLLMLVALVVRAGDWGEMLTREDALRQLESRDSRDRREGLARLAEIGTDRDVPFMLRLLHDDEPVVRGMAEQALWGLWLRADDLNVRRSFVLGVSQIHQQEIEQAIETFSELVAYKPEFAEAWNKRGDAWVHLGDSDRALADYEEVLRINPYHFGAMESCGEIWLARANARRSAEYFQRALAINPNLTHLVPILRTLEERLAKDRI